jgi:serine/threonine protein kinase
MHQMAFQDAIGIAIDIATAIQYIHSRRVLHLDLKPGNTGLLSANAVKILDFGTALNARLMPNGSSGNSMTNSSTNHSNSGSMSNTGSILVAANPNPRKASGTPGYCSPEQFRGDDTLTSASDIFSYALTIWELFTWHHPFVIKRDLSRVSPATSTMIQQHGGSGAPSPLQSIGIGYHGSATPQARHSGHHHDVPPPAKVSTSPRRKSSSAAVPLGMLKSRRFADDTDTGRSNSGSNSRTKDDNDNSESKSGNYT